MAWTQELQTVEDWEDDEGRERERLRPPQSDFLSLLACRQGTGHSVSASYRLHRSLQCEVNSCTKSRYRLLVIILNSFFHQQSQEEKPASINWKNAEISDLIISIKKNI